MSSIDEVNTTIETILSRRSVRIGYDGAPIPTDVLRRVIECGLAAPSSKNAQPWRFSVVTDRTTLASIADAVDDAPAAASYVPHDPSTGLPRPEWPSSVGESADVLRQVSAGIFVENRGPFSRGRAALLSAGPESQAAAMVGYELEIASLGAALQNMWLAALCQGLSGAFMGDVSVAEDAIKQTLAIQGDVLGVLALGHSVNAEGSSGRRPDPADPQVVRWLPSGVHD